MAPEQTLGFAGQRAIQRQGELAANRTIVTNSLEAPSNAEAMLARLFAKIDAMPSSQE